MYTLVTPTEGGCKDGDVIGTGTTAITVTQPADCPGTAQFGGQFTTSRGGSIMITPGGNKFGGTLRWFNGPNAFSYQRVSKFSPTWFRFTGGYPPVSQQTTADVPIEIGYVKKSRTGKSFRLTNPTHLLVDLLGTTTEGDDSKPCTDTAMTPAVRVFPPLSQQAATMSGGTQMNYPTDAGCSYYVKTGNYIRTGGPYTTGMIVNWDPNGSFSTKQTTTGYDNRTAMGLNGNISLVQPRLLHIYTKQPDSKGGESLLIWSSSRPRKMMFTFLPEPAGIAMLAAGFATLLGLHRLRRR
jgi:hypothetical protein